MKTCDRCGDEYESYPVFIKDDFNSISEYVETKEQFENLCKPCREELAQGSPIASNSEVE